MTTKVTKESLAENIGRLESYGDLSINEEYCQTGFNHPARLCAGLFLPLSILSYIIT